MLRRILFLFSFLVLTIPASCGRGDDGAVADATPVALEAFPLSVGSEWKYDITERTTYSQTLSITGTKLVDGQTVSVLGSGGAERAYFLRMPSAILQLPLSNAREYERAIGSRVVLKLPLRTGDKWVQVDKTVSIGGEIIAEFTEVTVLATEDIVTPAGYFAGAYPVYTKTEYRFLNTPGTILSSEYTKTEWIALGVGVVRRQSQTFNPTIFRPAQYEQLTAYSIVKG
jgi:hypothetical protein